MLTIIPISISPGTSRDSSGRLPERQTGDAAPSRTLHENSRTPYSIGDRVGVRFRASLLDFIQFQCYHGQLPTFFCCECSVSFENPVKNQRRHPERIRHTPLTTGRTEQRTHFFYHLREQMLPQTFTLHAQLLPFYQICMPSGRRSCGIGWGWCKSWAIFD